ncbi:MAG: histidine phosphatase family protein [Alicyclobacillus sp.]|nr:histidine phosphatase family protein [Alicyclobacillus sp.]
MLDLWLVRHGETNWNTEQRVQGWTDVPLNNQGRKQANLLGQSLQGIPFHVIFSSDLQRAKTTASTLQQYVPAPIRWEPALRERRYGAAEGMPRAESLKLYPKGAPDAESDAELSDRVQRFLHAVEREYPHHRVLCVSHGGWIRQALRVIGSSPPATLHNTSLTCLRWIEGQWQILGVDCTAHLDSVRSH